MPTGPKVGKGRRRRQTERSLRDGLPKTWNGFEAVARAISGKPRRRTTPIRNPSRAGDIHGDCHIAMGRARSVGGSGIFRLLRRRSAMCPSPQREARGAFGLK
jgi:hypothetical protein